MKALTWVVIVVSFVAVACTSAASSIPLDMSPDQARTVLANDAGTKFAVATQSQRSTDLWFGATQTSQSVLFQQTSTSYVKTQAVEAMVATQYFSHSTETMLAVTSQSEIAATQAFIKNQLDVINARKAAEDAATMRLVVVMMALIVMLTILAVLILRVVTSREQALLASRAQNTVIQKFPEYIVVVVPGKEPVFKPLTVIDNQPIALPEPEKQPEPVADADHFVIRDMGKPGRLVRKITEQEKRDNELMLDLVVDSIHWHTNSGRSGLGATQLGGWRDLGWNSKTWMRVTRLLGDEIVSLPGKGTFVAEKRSLAELKSRIQTGQIKTIEVDDERDDIRPNQTNDWPDRGSAAVDRQHQLLDGGIQSEGAGQDVGGPDSGYRGDHD